MAQQHDQDESCSFLPMRLDIPLEQLGIPDPARTRWMGQNGPREALLRAIEGAAWLLHHPTRYVVIQTDVTPTEPPDDERTDS